MGVKFGTEEEEGTASTPNFTSIGATIKVYIGPPKLKFLLRFE